MKTILITGINGFLGSHLAKHLKSKFKIIGLEYSLKNLHRIASDNFKVYSSFDHTLETIFEENDLFAVIHVATVYRKENEQTIDLLNTNINLPIRLLELSSKHKISVFVNTDSFFNNPSYAYSYLSDYTLSKKHCLDWIQLLAQSSSCKVVNMKIFHMYGENDAPNKFIPTVIKKIKNNYPILELTKGLQTRDFIYVRDVATAYEFVVNSWMDLGKYQEYEVGSGKSFTIKHLVLSIKEITNSSTDLIFGSLAYREGEIMESKANNSSLKKLGWKPEISIIEGLKKVVKNY